MELQNMSDDSDHGFKNPIRKGGYQSKNDEEKQEGATTVSAKTKKSKHNNKYQDEKNSSIP